ncbi:MAG TPA: 3'-5' exonuclease [Burkholderiaceae bacterium]|jgi:DNA polymerase-3 subunit epsilon|nr:3'-5' exonuclease [Burkholderiaceae bacterium]HPE01633.1 3'-5' exonuclease [Burkholderiaceae bacterium]HRZ01383.1 3'-5' exonuclease [Burkholderiaceae bacterium]
MSWLARLFGRDAGAAGAERWVVLDVETSGMNVAADALISIGAVAMVGGRVLPGDSLEFVVRQTQTSSRENILVHGVGRAAQLAGVDPAQAVERFLDYIGRAPLIAFHAPFDRGFLARAIKTYVNTPFDNPWLDLAELAPAVDPKARLKSLDEWLGRYTIPVSARHSAAADAFATALLAARLLPEAARQGARSFTQLQSLARSAKWIQ